MIQNWAGARVFGIILEYAAGGDLFDKIGTIFPAPRLHSGLALTTNCGAQPRILGYRKCWRIISSGSLLPAS
jgi:hypothetical protein